MDSKTIDEIESELSYLYSKKSNYGWTSHDVDRVTFLENLLDYAKSSR